MTSTQKEKIRKLYNQWHEGRAVVDDLIADLDNPWNKFVRHNLTDLAGKTVLEIGCGRGQLTTYLASKGASIIGADFSPQAVKITKNRVEKSGYKPISLNADACDLPLANDSIDFVISCETIEHTPKPQQALAEFYRVLKPSGRLILTFPSYLNMTGLYRFYLWLRNKPYNSGDVLQPIEQPLIAFCILRELEKLGFELLVTEGIAHYLLRPGKAPERMEWIDRNKFARLVLKPFALHYGVIAECCK